MCDHFCILQEAQIAVTPETLRRLVEQSLADRRTILNYLAGLPVRPSIRARIERALSHLQQPDNP